MTIYLDLIDTQRRNIHSIVLNECTVIIGSFPSYLHHSSIPAFFYLMQLDPFYHASFHITPSIIPSSERMSGILAKIESRGLKYYYRLLE